MKRFDCEAYDDGSTAAAAAAGALCFFADPGERICDSRASCEFRMAAERQRVFRLIHDRADVDPNMAYLAAEFTDPEQLLNGTLSREDSTPE